MNEIIAIATLINGIAVFSKGFGGADKELRAIEYAKKLDGHVKISLINTEHKTDTGRIIKKSSSDIANGVILLGYSIEVFEKIINGEYDN